MCPLSVVFSNSDQVLGCLPGLITAMGIYILEGLRFTDYEKKIPGLRGSLELQRNNYDVMGL